MPKMKTKRAAMKRFRVTKSGKVKFKRAKLRHLLTGKSAKTKMEARHPGYLPPGNARLVKECLPYA